MESDSSRTEKSSTPSTTRSRASAVKFVPDLTQLGNATKDLPNAEIWPDKTYTCAITVNGRQKTMEFTRKKVTRGSAHPHRWVYEGKVLIRNRDVPEDNG